MPHETVIKLNTNGRIPDLGLVRKGGVELARRNEDCSAGSSLEAGELRYGVRFP
jgi:hypothetical protein